MIRTVGAALAAALALLVSTAVPAAEFPSRPVTLIVPLPAGGATDRHLRTLAEATARHLGQPIVVENRPGASGTLGAAALATAKPDGYLLAQLPIPVFRLPYMQKMAFDPKKDFTYVIHVTGYTFGTIVRADSPWKTWKELLAYARENSNRIRYGSSGTSTTLHLTMEQIAKQEGLKWVHVPFKGEAEFTAAILGGHIEAVAGGTGSIPLIEAGQLRMLVVWTPERAARLPEVPTLLEEGHKIISTSPYGIGAPAGLDPKVTRILHDAFRKGMEEPAHREVLEQLSQPMLYKDTAEYTKFAMETIAEQQAILQELGLGQKN